MSTTTDVIFAALRTILMNENGLSEGWQVIRANRPGPRPSGQDPSAPGDYVAIHVDAIDIPVGTDETSGRYDSGTDILYRRTRGQRMGGVTFQAHGDISANWLERMFANLLKRAHQAILRDAGFTVKANGGLISVPVPRGGGWEQVFQREAELTYAVLTEPEVEVALASIAVAAVFERFDGDPAALTPTIEVDL